MRATEIAAMLALAAALMVAVGDVLQQRSAQQVTTTQTGTVALFRRLLGDRRWWAGSLVAGAGFGLQAAALAVGSVVLVQALLVTSLLFALVINARLNHTRITGWQTMWAVLLAAAVTVVVTVGDPTAGTPRGSLRTWTVVAAVLGPVLVLCVVGARIFSGSTPPAGRGTAGPTCSGRCSVSIQPLHGMQATPCGPAGRPAVLRTGPGPRALPPQREVLSRRAIRRSRRRSGRRRGPGAPGADP